MPQADASRAIIRYARESQWGETPSAVSATAARVTGETLGHQKATVVSDEIRSDRQRTAVLEVGQAAAGDIGFEMAWSDFEGFLENALRGTIASTTKHESSCTFAASSITGSAAQSFNAFSLGQWIHIDGGANNNAIAKITAKSSTALTITGTTLTASTASVAITGRTLVNGTTKTSYFIETDFDDLTAVKYFNGMSIDQMTLDVRSQAIVVGTFSFMGKRGFVASTSKASVTTSAGVAIPLTAAVNVAQIRENGTALSTAVASISLRVANNMRAKPKVASKTGVQHGDGTLDVSGNLTAYFEDKTLYQRYIDHTVTQLDLIFKDSSNNIIVISMPEVVFTAGDPTAAGADQDVFVPLDFVAYRDSAWDNTLRFDFLPA